uniref:ORF9 n=1 Tax=Malaco herpesvirus 1 TaxID=3031797 RepID=A0AA48P8B6_9VIRU|nr:TPA_asm: ORF9 [Malaco herpesvirus 1]
MSVLLSLTDLPCKSIISDGSDTQGDGMQDYKSYSVDDYMSFITTSNVAGLKKNACDYYDDIRDFVSDPRNNIDKLVNRQSLEHEIGVDSELIDNIVKKTFTTTKGDPLQTISMACYLNAGGLTNVKDQVVALHNHFIKSKPKEKRDNEDEVSNYELFASIDHSSKLLMTATALNKDEFGEVLKSAEEAAINSPQTATANKSSTKISEENVFSNLTKVIAEGRFNSLTVLNETAVQFGEPEINIDYFLRLTSDWEELNQDNDLIKSFETCLKDKTVNVIARFVTCREELYNIVMPLRFRLHEQDSTPAIDVYLQQLLGAHAGFIRAFYETSRFTDLAVSQNTTEIITAINKTMKKISAQLPTQFNFKLNPTAQDMAQYTLAMIREWDRIMCFIIYLEIVRNTIPDLMELEVGEIDKGLNDIPNMKLYYYQGYYFGKINDDGFTSRCFKTLLAKLFNQTQNQ